MFKNKVIYKNFSDYLDETDQKIDERVDESS